ncbi:hypothetical protein [Solemya velum gill symbiont]|uniref:hypothetical protein n=1 Tax=Solemya velum gill symbiont TaxID=2340 RepID=UPI000998B1E5|nr:hypothetical protein [Solemya velum gill symbiont]OOY37449.1 hypothetical protein BOV89_06995 [Solemya velum gill symbiont]
MHGRKPKRKPKGYWSTLDHLRAVAKKYGCRKEFAKKSGSAYSAARKNGCLNKICSHMPAVKSKQPGYCTFDRVKKEAMKYNAQADFIRNSPSAYRAAQKMVG